MTPEQIEQERTAFESWARDAFPGLDLVKLAHKGEIVGFTERTTIKMFAAWLTRAKQTGWISVQDRLPQQSGNCLAVCRSVVSGNPYTKIMYYDADDQTFRTAACGNIMSSHTSHWQPLPKPPAGEAA